MGEYPAGGADPSRRFEGRTAIITGGSSGTGRATAQRLAGEDAAIVLLGYGVGRGRPHSRAAKELAATGASAVFLPVDLRDDNAIASVTAELRDRLDAVHVLVNSVGVVHINGRQVSTFTEGGLTGGRRHRRQPARLRGPRTRTGAAPNRGPVRGRHAFLSADGLSQHDYFSTRGMTYFSFVVILSFSELNLTRVMNDKEILKITEASAS